MVLYEHINCFNEYDPKRSYPISNWPEKNKPNGGLWGSRVGSSSGWENYMKQADEELLKIHPYPEGFVPPEFTKFYFKLKDNANLYIVENLEDFKKLPKSIDETGKEYIDYVKCLKQGIDAVELCSIGDEFEEYLKSMSDEDLDKFDEEFCSHWQCDSIVVLNPDAYEIIS